MKTDKGTHITIDRERYKQLQEENKKLKEEIKLGDDELFLIIKQNRQIKQEKQELLEALEEVKQCTSNFDTYNQLEELINKYK